MPNPLSLGVAKETRSNYKQTKSGSKMARVRGWPLTDGNDDVEDEVCKQYPNISPAVSISDVQRLVELVADSELAVAAVRGVVGVVQISTSDGDESTGPGGAGLTGWRAEQSELFRSTSDNQTARKIVSTIKY